MWGWVSCLCQRVGDYFIASRRLPPPGSFWKFWFHQGPLPTNTPITASHLQPSHLLHGFPSNQESKEVGFSSSSGPGRDLLQPPSWCRPFRHVSSHKLSEDQRRAAVNTQRDVLAVLLQPSLKHAINIYVRKNLDLQYFIWQVLYFLICEMNNDQVKVQD